MIRALIALTLIGLLGGCAPHPTATPSPDGTSAPVTEQPVQLLPLEGPLASRKAEISGLAWYGDWLILLPQYPARFGDDGGALFALSRADLAAAIDGTRTSLTPKAIPFDDAGLRNSIAGFEGFEAVAFDHDRIYLTIEASPGSAMLGHLVSGTIAPDLSAIHLQAQPQADIPPQAALSNTTDEALIVTADGLATFYEANGANVNPAPVAHLFDASLNPQGTIPFPTLEYRVTDASSLDENGRFWVINYFWPGDKDKLQPATDALAQEYGQGATHRASQTVERLVELQYHKDGIARLDRPPIQLELLPKDARNWEGLVRFGDRGFLLATDTYPETMLGFVPLTQ